MSEHPASSAMPSGPFDPAGIVWSRVSPRLATARLLSAGIALAVVVVVAGVLLVVVDHWWPWVLVALVVIDAVWTAVVVPRQVRAIGYAERDDDLLIRKGILFRTLVVVPYGRMQYVDVQAGPLARRMRIAQIQLHTASASTDATIDGLEPAEAERLRDRLASRGEARLAGL
ncbi:PH domain-containing protein [Cellulosimicrobium arenosum]|uniref:PH domain-containing protein n=1 Tax=Cellulosimicrobium arenosum TaxID=2708133 RepID=A0A927G9Z2_9MICO|nr:PH domain-containing protein [Cellulosimicrobium arenosum]MBD8079122.1 PH domain-containing protein [Cellulosimicrobium arenosum]